jgi:hypothetical protein
MLLGYLPASRWLPLHLSLHPATSKYDTVYEVEGQLPMRLDIVIAVVKEHRDAAAYLATMLDDPIRQRLDIFAWNPTLRALKEGADGVSFSDAIDACDVLAVLVYTGVVGVVCDLQA